MRQGSILTGVAVLLVSLGLCWPAGAAPQLDSLEDATLQDMIDAGSDGVMIGDKRFFNFDYSRSQSEGSVTAPSASSIAVGVANSGHGIKFTSLWVAQDNSFMDSVISYEVFVEDPAWVIDGVGLLFNGNAPDPGPFTFATVSETVFVANPSPPPAFEDAGSLSVINHGDREGFTNRNQDFIGIDPSRHVLVSKDIGVSAGPGGTSTISVVENTFTQIPEPASLGVLAMAVVLLSRRARRISIQ